MSKKTFPIELNKAKCICCCKDFDDSILLGTRAVVEDGIRHKQIKDYASSPTSFGICDECKEIMKTAYIIHGAYGTPGGNWFQWLAAERSESRGHGATQGICRSSGAGTALGHDGSPRHRIPWRFHLVLLRSVGRQLLPASLGTEEQRQVPSSQGRRGCLQRNGGCAGENV